MGSTRAALRAGIQQAPAAVTASKQRGTRRPLKALKADLRDAFYLLHVAALILHYTFCIASRRGKHS